MKRIYCISGLGADYRLFTKLSVKGYELVPVSWVPFNKKDTLPGYAAKLIAQIHDEDAIVIGLSFGGMIAVEIAKQFPLKKVFIVSSAKTASELSIPCGAVAKALINSGVLPGQLFSSPNAIALSYLGAMSEDTRQLLRAIIRDANGRFVKWALGAIVNWENDSYTGNVVHIHGTADRVIHSRKVRPNYWIQNGSHVMIYDRAEEVSKIISDCLAS